MKFNTSESQCKWKTIKMKNVTKLMQSLARVEIAFVSSAS